MSTTQNPTTTDYTAMVDYLENLLARQRDRLSVYDIDGASEIANETAPLTEELTRQQMFKGRNLPSRAAACSSSTGKSA